MFKIMIVEDDIKIRTLMTDILQKYGYAVVEVVDFLQVEKIFEQEAPQLVLLDLNLPYYDGFYYCRVFRRKTTVPIIIISARDEESSQVLSMELGADDYIVKPLNIQVLLAKIMAILRRGYGEYSGKPEAEKETLPIHLDDRNFSISHNGMVEELSKNEYKLLKKLMEKKDTIVSREELLEELWDDVHFVVDNTLTVNVTRVKSKLANLGFQDVIKVKRGVGYIFELGQTGGSRS
ncbi:transcriptional regulator [Paenibacillus sp. FSL R7-0273]|uniref:response regulator transcription factor n=1 Tax=Paenibacillus sp. FSL R7-0273 TaxID=1536772 RepID=UPI0004F82BDE|nr:response regulator transcription factor [Paenibacillus sp. FSL R7-0273]AIQ47436.1 transcriptional regulator [Paenibacillus sp. FSL R7-0273]OMF96004.1 DNA-binding response regulator [Paenibacillus sp. FSL R7-0273]